MRKLVFLTFLFIVSITIFYSINCKRFSSQQMASRTLLACDFEVFGIVQGVFFRKYTEKQAKSLGLRGWCMNTSDGTVKGQLEGNQKQINDMQLWLKTKGSPSSRIDKAVFSEPKEIADYSFTGFTIKR